MTKPILLIDDLFFDDQARERCAMELEAYTAILDQQEHLQTTKTRLLARLQTIGRELQAADYCETSALLCEQETINSSLRAIRSEISRTEYQRVIAHLMLLHAQWQDLETYALETTNRELEVCDERASKLAEAAKTRARHDYGCELTAYAEWWEAASAAAQRTEQVVREALSCASSRAA